MTVKLFLFPKVLFLYLSEDENSICRAMPWHETQINGVDIDLSSDNMFRELVLYYQLMNTFNYLYLISS